jgi:hypothetical protein
MGAVLKQQTSGLLGQKGNAKSAATGLAKGLLGK